MIETILVPLDGSALGERALPYALRLARAVGARLLLLHAVADLDLLSRLEATRGITLHLERHLDALRRSGVAATSRVAHLLPASAILATLRDDHADLIVMATHGRGVLGRWVFGSVADDVIRQAGVPVVLVSAACDRAWAEDRPLRVLVPLDGSSASEAALAAVGALCGAVGGDLWLVRAIEEPFDRGVRYDPEGTPTPSQAGAHDLEEALRYLEAVAGRLGDAFPSIDILADVGEASQVIAETAQRADADLIAMATHGRAGIARLAEGSVSAQVVAQARCPVMLVRVSAPSACQSEASRDATRGAGAGRSQVGEAGPTVDG